MDRDSVEATISILPAVPLSYTVEDFELLLKTLSKIEGKFLLSSYPGDILKEYTKTNGWNTVEIAGTIGTHARAEKRKSKVEVLTANYGIKP